jgi:hypothetical protein
MTPFHKMNDTSLLLAVEEDFSPKVEESLYEKHGANLRYTGCPCGSVTFHLTMRSLVCAHCTAEVIGH